MAVLPDVPAVGGLTNPQPTAAPANRDYSSVNIWRNQINYHRHEYDVSSNVLENHRQSLVARCSYVHMGVIPSHVYSVRYIALKAN